jgi:Outer membrane protein beta-barrel domain
MKSNILLFMALLCASVMNAQRIQIVGGINYSNIRFGKTMVPNTNFVEKYRAFGGYQIGLKLELGRDEDTQELGLFSLSLEALIAQKGANYYYSGPSSQVWAEVETVKSIGTVETKLEIANTYLKLPISISVNVNQRLSLQVGGYASVLVRSTGTGTMNYSGSVVVAKKAPPYPKQSLDTFKIKSFQTELNFNYLDEYDAAIVRLGDSLLCPANASLGFRPKSVGAYYDRNGRTGLMFNRLDLGLHAGLKLEGSGWLLSARVSYGLLDVFNNEYHANPTLDENKKNVLNTNTQRNISYELNLGFKL